MAFGKVHEMFWDDPRIRAASEPARHFMLYLMTCRHKNRLGCFVLDPFYAAADLQWERGNVTAAIIELIDAGRILYDTENRIVFVRHWLKHNTLENEKVVTGAAAEVRGLPATPLLVDLLAAVEKHQRDHYKKLLEVLRYRIANDLPNDMAYSGPAQAVAVAVAVAKPEPLLGDAAPEKPAPPTPEPKVKRGTALPDDVAALVDDSHRRIIADAPGVRLSVELEQFADHHRAKGTIAKDWKASLRTWLRNAVKFAARDNRPPSGSQAAAVRNERPQADAPRLGRPSPAAGPDPLDEQRRREAAEDERIRHWQQAHPEDAKRIAVELRQEMEADPRWHGTPQAILEAAARGELRRRILAKLGPRAA
jgi:hypothetical protein